jgi:hypothetical protein
MSTNYLQQATIQSFERLMDAVSKSIHGAVENDPDPDLLSKVEALTEKVTENIEVKGFTLPPQSFPDLHHAFQTRSQAPQQLAAQPHPTGHRLLWYLLWRYRDSLTASVGAEEADRHLSELVGAFRRRPGRPAKLSLVTIMKAKQLSDAGKSYAEVAILLKLTRQQVRAALRHHYPEKKST